MSYISVVCMRYPMPSFILRGRKDLDSRCLRQLRFDYRSFVRTLNHSNQLHIPAHTYLTYATLLEILLRGSVPRSNKTLASKGANSCCAKILPNVSMSKRLNPCCRTPTNECYDLI